MILKSKLYFINIYFSFAWFIPGLWLKIQEKATTEKIIKSYNKTIEEANTYIIGNIQTFSQYT